MKTLGKPIYRWLTSATLCALALGANAEPGFGEETVVLRLGSYFSDFDTNVKLSGPNGGTGINLEDALGLDSDQAVLRGGLAWRIAPRHRLVLEYVDFNRESTGISERSFTIDTDDGFYEFSAGARLTTQFDWRLIPLTYTYSFYRADDLELAGSVGVHWFKTSIGFAGEATVTPPGGVPTPVASTAEEESASGPLPVFGLQGSYALTKHWVIGAKLGWFGLDYDDYSGELWDLGVTTEYWFNDHFGAGLGYSYYTIDLTVEDGRFKTSADYTYGGVNAYIALRY
jgi:hypothetical protein